MTLAKRLRLRLEEVGLSQSELARRVRVSQGTISGLLSGVSQGSSHLHKIARELGTTPEYLSGETDDPTAGALPAPSPEIVAEQLDAVLIPHLDLSFSMGGGNVIEEPVVLGHVSFSRAWLRGRISGRIEDVALISGEGDSMEPTIRDGDMLLIDRSQRRMRQQDQIWAIALRDVGMVKRLRRARAGGFEIHSDNPAVSVDHADDGEMELVGRVIWIGRWT